jgi:hypothetical protein
LTSLAFFAIMPEFQRACALVGTHLSEMQGPGGSKTMIRNAKKLSLALLVACALLAAVAVVGVLALHAESRQSNSSDKPQASPTPAAAANPRKPQTLPAKTSGIVWVNTDRGVYHKEGSRWFGKTNHAKYMLETDAVKAGYKPVM